MLICGWDSGISDSILKCHKAEWYTVFKEKKFQNSSILT